VVERTELISSRETGIESKFKEASQEVLDLDEKLKQVTRERNQYKEDLEDSYHEWDRTKLKIEADIEILGNQLEEKHELLVELETVNTDLKEQLTVT
jgi:hypothetical protein